MRILLTCICVLILLPTNYLNAEENRPNIIVILADDLGWGDVSWHKSEIPTPHLQELAQSGAELDFFYVQPVCTPTRAAFLTGRYPIRHGLQVGVIRPWAQYGLPLEEQTLAQGLKSSGYATAVVGKWHLGHFQTEYLPTRRGFDHQYGHYNGAIDYFEHTRDGGFDWHRNDQVSRDEGYSTHLIGDESVRIIREYAGKQPFFLYVAFNAVHSPHQVPQEYLKNFDHLKGDRKLYAGMLTAMDEAIGKILKAVEETGQRSDTLVIFSSDNGGPAPGRVTSNGPLRASKATVYEGGVRVPAVASWPGRIPAGAVVKEPIHIVDLYPTLLNLVGAKVDQKLPLDGLDVWKTIVNGEPSPHSEILLNAAPNWGALRSGQWKLVVNGKRASDNFDGQDQNAAPAEELGEIELFDLSNDPFEANNLAKQYPDKTKELVDRWLSYRNQAVPPKSQPKPKDFVSPPVWGPTTPAVNGLATGDQLPPFESVDDQGQAWKSSDHVGKKFLVYYFYPADFTGGCTRQACAYRDRKSELEELGAEVIGISGDSIENHKQFKQLHGLNFTLLADPEGALAQLFGVPLTRETKQVSAAIGDQNLTFQRDVTAKRWTFVVDKSGKVVYRNDAVKAAEDTANVIEVLRSLQASK